MDEPLDPLEADDILDLQARSDRLRVQVSRRAPQMESTSRYTHELVLRVDGFDHPQDGDVITRFSLDVPEEILDALTELSGWGISHHPDWTLGEIVNLASSDSECPVHDAANFLTSWIPRNSASIEEAAAIEILRNVAHLLEPEFTELLAVFEWSEDEPNRAWISKALGIDEEDLSRRLARARRHLVEQSRIPAAWPVRALARQITAEVGGHPSNPVHRMREILRERFNETPPLDCVGLLVTGFCGYVRDDAGWWRQQP